MFRSYITLTLVASYLSISPLLAEPNESALRPLVSLQTYWENKAIVAQTFEIADWANQLTFPDLENLADLQPNYAILIKDKGLKSTLKFFLEKKAYQELKSLGVWIRFPDLPYFHTYYFLPHFRPAREVLAFFDTIENQNRRVDILSNPIFQNLTQKSDSPNPRTAPDLLLRIPFSQLMAAVESDKESLPQVLHRISQEIKANLSNKDEAPPEKLAPPCLQYLQEIGSPPSKP